MNGEEFRRLSEAIHNVDKKLAGIHENTKDMKEDLDKLKPLLCTRTYVTLNIKA